MDGIIRLDITKPSEILCFFELDPDKTNEINKMIEEEKSILLEVDFFGEIEQKGDESTISIIEFVTTSVREKTDTAPCVVDEDDLEGVISALCRYENVIKIKTFSVTVTEETTTIFSFDNKKIKYENSSDIYVLTINT